MKTDTSNEKLALLILAGIALLALAWIALRALQAGTVDANAATVLGVIVGGLIAIAKDIIAAIRGYAMSAQLGKVTDQLAASGPVTDPMAPQAVTVVNEPSDPVPVTGNAA